MKKFNLFMYSSLVSLLAGFFIFSCQYGEETLLNASIPKLPLYDADYIGKKIGENHQNCCQCQTSACSASKCCSGGQSCNCSCSVTWLGTHSCTCGDCRVIQQNSPNEGLDLRAEYFELWLNEQQYLVWKEFSEILHKDGSRNARNAMKGLLQSYDAIVDDDYDAYIDGKIQMTEYVMLLSRKTKNEVNSFLDKYEFEDEKL